MKRLMTLASVAVLLLAFSGPALAHFGMVLPSEPTVMETEKAEIKLNLKFWHPFENIGMNLVKPKSFQVFFEGKANDLLPTLQEVQERGFSTWEAAYKPIRPGLYTFVMEPTPYWEPQEDCFIIHYTKAYLDAYGDDEGWDEPTPGLKTEIVPLAKPTGLYAGNVFSGRVLLDGKPVAGAEVEIEWYPGPDKKGQAPYDTMVTQSVKADGNGVFSYAAPKAGWWGFAALNTADYQLKQGEEDKDVELGAVIWVYFHEMMSPLPVE